MTEEIIIVASKALRAAAAKAGKAEQRLTVAREKVSRIAAQRADAAATTAELRERITTAAVDATLKGIAMPAADPALADRLRAAESAVTGADRAQPIAEVEAKLAAETLTAAQAEVTIAKISWFSAQQEHAANEIRRLLDPVARSLARLRAIDRAQAAIIGEYFPAVLGKLPRPWSGQVVASKFVRGLVARLQPPSFEASKIADLSNSELISINRALKELTHD